ncbi:hypothetical protein CVT24_002250 [Panaeolus cyanescens]|uniref:F-box domain-containing protein n=1 Tax=Panaeolus cyanescens TaxID=181874 RepID=A0A409YIF2_9AGAR|nr:hypothetical protein CVT24_002250 [Panaeolus cyanescens]
MTLVAENTHKRTIPNDIIHEVIDILAAIPPPNPDLQDPPGRLQINKFHPLSFFCLQHARKHIFGIVNLGTFDPKSFCLIINKPPKHLPALGQQLSFFAEHSGTLPYIRHLSLFMYQREIGDLSVQAKLYDVIVHLQNLTSLNINLNQSPWTSIPSLASRSLRSALRTLVRSSQNLSELTLSRVSDFCLDDLVNATSLQCLDIQETNLMLEDNTTKVGLNSLKRLIIHQYPNPQEFEHLVGLLVNRDRDGNLVVTLPQLKGLSFAVVRSSDLSQIVKIVNTHGAFLEELTFMMYLDGKSPIPTFI